MAQELPMLGLASGVSSTMTRKGDVRQGIKIELVTIVWMVIEASVAITVGFTTHSVSLQGFGIDRSVILTILLALLQSRIVVSSVPSNGL